MSLKLILSVFRQNICTKRYFRCNVYQLKDAQKTEITDEPVKYTTSNAAKWKALYSSSGEDYFQTPRIQPLVVVMSLTAFMVYFCMLREENDLDDWLRNLEKTVPLQVEEVQLRTEIEAGRKRGINVSFQEARLKEIQNLKKALT